MSFVSVTRLRVRSIRFLPFFAMRAIRTRKQASEAPGFHSGSLLADRDWTFWTMTMWDSQESMRFYMTAAAHRTAMPYLMDWCDEASVVHWDEPGEVLPTWVEAERRMRESGRASKVRNPSPQHATLTFRPARIAAGVKIVRKPVK